MSGDQAVQAFVMLGFALLVLSGLVARRLPFGQVVRMIVAWVAIFGVVLVGVAFRGDIQRFGRELHGRIDPAGGIVAGDSLRIPLSEDGHYWVRGRVDGVEVRFLIDSGATTTALSAETVARAGLRERGIGGVRIATANGVVEARRVTIARLEVGGIVRSDLGAVTSPAFGGANVLGMNFLSSLGGWGVEDGVLVLRP